MSTYIRIRVADKSLILRSPRRVSLLGHECLTGVEVNRDGDEVGGRTEDGRTVDERQHIIQVSLIKAAQRMEMSRQYGWLEPVGKRGDLAAVIQG